MNRITARMRAKSVRLHAAVDGNLKPIMTGWFVLAIVASVIRVMVSPLQKAPDMSTVMPYLLLVGGPLLSMAFALHWFRDGDREPYHGRRSYLPNRWRSLDPVEARAHPLYGPTGLMVSLLIGMLLNVPVRALEYLAAMPALAGQVPHWLATLRLVMTIDVVLLTSLYTIAFVAALQKAPVFPRLLATVWIVDLSMQLVIAKSVAAAGGLPADVGAALHAILDGNVQKVLISVAIWLPYLILSNRVNVTYRHRI